MTRLQKLRQSLAQQGLDAFLVSQAENRRYLSGFTGSAGALLISASDAFLTVDFRYLEQAKRETSGFEVIQIKGMLADWLPQLVTGLRFGRIGFEADSIALSTYHKLTEQISSKHFQIQMVPLDAFVEPLRTLKEPEELVYIARAVELVDAAVEHIKSIIRPEIMEKEIAWELEKFLRESGSEALPFEPIVASGYNSALPHAKPSEKAIHPGEPLLLDIGARVNGYCSDLSRTLCLGKPDETFSRVYDIILGTQLAAIATIESGMSCDQADRLARTIIEQAGYGEAFGHGLGHGIGLAAHESPRVGPDSSDILADGMVFTIEPGIYIPGWGGVRIEDTVMMEKGKVKILTREKKGSDIV